MSGQVASREAAALAIACSSSVSLGRLAASGRSSVLPTVWMWLWLMLDSRLTTADVFTCSIRDSRNTCALRADSGSSGLTGMSNPANRTRKRGMLCKINMSTDTSAHGNGYCFWVTGLPDTNISAAVHIHPTCCHHGHVWPMLWHTFCAARPLKTSESDIGQTTDSSPVDVPMQKHGLPNHQEIASTLVSPVTLHNTYLAQLWSLMTNVNDVSDVSLGSALSENRGRTSVATASLDNPSCWRI